VFSLYVHASKRGMHAPASESHAPARDSHAPSSSMLLAVSRWPMVFSVGDRSSRGGAWSSRASTDDSQPFLSTGSMLFLLLFFYVTLAIVSLRVRLLYSNLC
jgi:hypothetical protein